MGVRMTLENFKLKLESLYPQLVLIGDYINLSTKTRFKCLECGYEFEKEPTIMFGKNGGGCPRCAGRAQYTLEETDAEGNLTMRYEKVSFDEKVSLTQLDLMKEELIATQKYKKPNGTIQFDLSHEAKQKNMFDDRADVFCMICDRLMELRAQEALTLEEKPVTDFKDALGRFRGNKKVSENPFNNRSKANPFARYGRMK